MESLVWASRLLTAVVARSLARVEATEALDGNQEADRLLRWLL